MKISRDYLYIQKYTFKNNFINSVLILLLILRQKNLFPKKPIESQKQKSEIEKLKEKYAKKEKEGYVRYEIHNQKNKKKKLKEFVIGSVDLQNHEEQLKSRENNLQIKKNDVAEEKNNLDKSKIKDSKDLNKRNKEFKESIENLDLSGQKIEIYSQKSEDLEKLTEEKKIGKKKKKKKMRANREIIKFQKFSKKSSRRQVKENCDTKKILKKSCGQGKEEILRGDKIDKMRQVKKEIIQNYLQDEELIGNDIENDQNQIDSVKKKCLQVNKMNVEKQVLSERRSRVENILENIGKKNLNKINIKIFLLLKLIFRFFVTSD